MILGRFEFDVFSRISLSLAYGRKQFCLLTTSVLGYVVMPRCVVLREV